MRFRLDLLLFCLGTLFLSRSAWSVLKFHAFQSHPDFVAAVHNSWAATPTRAQPGLQVLGRVEIPRLKLSTLVVEGDEEETLAYAAGHVPGTAALGGKGNSAIAGHRESAFRELRGIRIGDSVHITAAGSTYDYVVQSTRIVSPDDVHVLLNTGSPLLTLITCYPFRFVGNAPKRFVVQASLEQRGSRS